MALTSRCVTSLRAGAPLVGAAVSARCHGNDVDFLRANVTSPASNSIEMDSSCTSGSGSEEIATAGSRPTLAVLPVVSGATVRRQFGADHVTGHVTAVNTTQIQQPQVVCHSMSSYQQSNDTESVHHHHHQQQQQQQQGKTGPTQSVSYHQSIKTHLYSAICRE